MGELRTIKRGKKWEWSFEGARIGGKRQPISKGGYRTKAEAIAAGTQAKAEYESAGRVFRPAEISVADYLDYWYENYVMRNLSYNTQQDYKGKIKNHIVPELGKYRLVSLESDIIQKWIDKKKDEGYAQSMLKNILTCLSGALNYAVQPCRYIKANPCIYVKTPKVPTSEERKAHTEYICTREDYQAIIARFPEGSIFYLPILTGYHCGTRIGETYGIDLMQDIDFETNTLHIRHQMKKEDGAIIQAPADVSVDFPEIMPLSARENGQLLTPESFKYCARVVHKELGNPLFHSHCLRHTHGTILAENGAQPKTVMERLGHKDLKTTMERYIFNTDKMQDDAVKLFMQATS